MSDGKKDPALDEACAPMSGAAAPANDVGIDLGVTRESLDGYLARPSTGRLVEAMTGTRYARSEPTLDGWMVAVAAHAVSHHFRTGVVDANWLRRDVEVEEQPADPPEDLRGEERWMIDPWLRDQVKNDPDDRELFELLVDEARSGKSFATVAAEHRMTPAALSKRAATREVRGAKRKREDTAIKLRARHRPDPP